MNVKNVAAFILTLLVFVLSVDACHRTDPNANRVGTAYPTGQPFNPSWTVAHWYLNDSTGSNTNSGTTSGAPLSDPDEIIRRWGATQPTLRQKTIVEYLVEPSSGAHPIRMAPQIAIGGGLTIKLPLVQVYGPSTLGTVTAKSATSVTPWLQANIGTSVGAQASQLLLDSTQNASAWIDPKGVTGSTTTSANFTQPAVNSNVVVSLNDNTWLMSQARVTIGTCQYLVIGGFLAPGVATFQNTGSGTCPSPGATVASGAAVAPVATNVAVLSQPFPSNTVWDTLSILPNEVNTVTTGDSFTIARPSHLWVDELSASVSSDGANIGDRYIIVQNAWIQASGTYPQAKLFHVLLNQSIVGRSLDFTAIDTYGGSGFVNDLFGPPINLVNATVYGGIALSNMGLADSYLDGDLVAHGNVTAQSSIRSYSSLSSVYMERGGGVDNGATTSLLASGVGGSAQLYGPYSWNVAHGGYLVYANSAATAFGNAVFQMQINGVPSAYAVDVSVSPNQVLGERSLSVSQLDTSTASGGFSVPGGGGGYARGRDGASTIIAETARTNLPAPSAFVQATANGGTGLSAPGTSGNCLVSNGTIWTTNTCGGGAAFYQTVKAFGTAQPQRSFLNFNGSGVTVGDDGTNTNVSITQGYATIQNNTTGMPQRSTLDFVGFTVTDDSGSGRTIVTAPTTGAPFYQALLVNGTTELQQPKLNLLAGTNISLGFNNNGGASSSEVTVNWTSPSFYNQTLQVNGTSLPQEPTANFVSGNGVAVSGGTTGSVSNITVGLATNAMVPNFGELDAIGPTTTLGSAGVYGTLVWSQSNTVCAPTITCISVSGGGNSLTVPYTGWYRIHFDLGLEVLTTDTLILRAVDNGGSTPINGVTWPAKIAGSSTIQTVAGETYAHLTASDAVSIQVDSTTVSSQQVNAWGNLTVTGFL